MSIHRHADLFTPPPQWRITQPPGADWYVLLYGERVMAQGDMDTINLHPRLTRLAT